jgi:hypothetical protein
VLNELRHVLDVGVIPVADAMPRASMNGNTAREPSGMRRP